MKPFNLEKALAGAPVFTRDGRQALEIHYFEKFKGKYPLYVLIEGDNIPLSYTQDGAYAIGGHTDNDLVMGPTKQVGYVNLYRVYQNVHNSVFSSNVYEDEKTAIENRIAEGSKNLKFLKCVKVEWEE